MKKIMMSSSLLLFVVVSVMAQMPEMTKADSLRKEGKVDLALEEYAKQYAANPDDRDNTYNYACAYALTWKKDSAFHYLNLATAKDSSVQALNDPDFYFLISDPRWAELEDALVERVEAKHEKYEDVELSKELWRMKIKDQAFYYHLDVAEKQGGQETPLAPALWELKEKLNEENVARIEEIIEEQGWPKKSIVKERAAGTVFLVIQHADIDVQKKYLPLMREAADAGEAKWSSLALLIDRVNLRDGKQQIYGSQIGRNEAGEFFVKDLEAPEYVNQRRAKVGLRPIEDYVKFWGMEWTIEQKEK